MMGLINNTYAGGLLAHVLTLFPYLLGSVVYIVPAGLLANGKNKSHPHVFTALLGIAGLSSLQYVIKVPKWTGFRNWFIDLGARSYYKKCTLGGNLKDIKDEKVFKKNTQKKKKNSI